MTDKELRKLKRAELLEILFYLQKEMEHLKEENENLRKQVEGLQLSLSEEELKKLSETVKAAVQEAMQTEAGQ